MSEKDQARAEWFAFVDPSRFDGSKDGRTCRVQYHAEIVPLHRFDLPNAPVSAYKVRILGGGYVPGSGTEHWPIEWWGPRRENLTAAVADLEELEGAVAR